MALMNALVLAAALLAGAEPKVDWGWEPLAQGGYRYIIQIPPDQVDLIVNSYDVECTLPDNLDVRHVTITVGNKKLPQDPAASSTASTPVDQSGTGDGDPAAEEQPTEGDNLAEGAAEPASLRVDSPSTPLADQSKLSESRKSQQAEKKPALNTAGKPTTTKEEAKPWLPLVATAVALLASLGGNVYLGWVAVEARRRYQRLLVRSREPVGV
jgi:hypothetical protein